jgi:hypothetical protein
MAYEQQNNTGYLFPNKYHKKGDKNPCLKGQVVIDGVIKEIAVWAPRDGKKGYFCRFQDPQDRKKDQPAQQQAPAAQEPPKTESKPVERKPVDRTTLLR